MDYRTALSPRLPLTAVIAATALTLTLTACGVTADTSTATTAASTSSATADHGLTLTDGWVKAMDAAPTPSAMAAPMSMTAMFGTLRNDTATDVTVTAGSSELATMVELHETVSSASGQNVMQPKTGGFVVPAGGSLDLRPGGNHIMLMGLTALPANGTTATVTLTTSVGEVTFTVPVRTFAGAGESYVPTPSST